MPKYIAIFGKRKALVETNFPELFKFLRNKKVLLAPNVIGFNHELDMDSIRDILSSLLHPEDEYALFEVKCGEGDRMKGGDGMRVRKFLESTCSNESS